MISKKSLLALSIGAILSISLVTSGGITQVFADDDDRHKGKPHLKNDQCFVTTMAQGLLSQEAKDNVNCKIKAWFNKDGTALFYKIKIDGMTVSGDSKGQDTVSKMHLHEIFMTNPQGEPMMSPKHILNIWLLPGMDDDDLVAKVGKGKFHGKWDNSDATDRPGDHDDTFKLTDQVENLCNEKTFLMVHGNGPDNNNDGMPDSLPGFLKGPLKLTHQGEKVCNKLLDSPNGDNDEDDE